MRFADDTSNCAAARRVALRMRPDLVVRSQRYGEDRYWLVKDPVALTYFHLREEEYAILQMLDNRASLAEIKRRFEEKFCPLQITFEQLQAFLGRLHESGLLLAEAAGQGQVLLERRAQHRRRARLGVLSNVLAIRFRGLDPEPFLRWLYDGVRWMFTFWFLAGCLLLAIAALTLAVFQFHAFQARLPDFHQFFTVRNAIWLGAALIVAKVLHELGHALACKHFGGECHEIGILFLVFTPCLYCNVSDSWMFSNKWQRIAVSAAGVGVEIVLAAVAAFLWRLSTPGLLNTLCLNMMFVCSVSTVLFNGNPLLRFDGYYILADALDVPNLDLQARSLVRRGLASFFFDLQLPHDRSLPGKKRFLVAAYGVASAVYRWLLVLAVLWFCYRVLKPYGFEPLAQTLVVVVFAGMIGPPVWNCIQFFRHPAHDRRIRRGRAVVSGGVLVASAVIILLVPLPFSVSAPVVLEPQNAQRVYVTVPGRLVRSVSVGEAVAKGQELGQLANLDIHKEVVELAAQRSQQHLLLQNLRLRLAGDPSAAPQIPAAEEALTAIEEQLLQRELDEANLVLHAPVSGTALPPPRLSGRPYVPSQLGAWHGTPLEERNLGSHLETGTLFCMVGCAQPVEAFLIIDQSDVNFVREGQQVRIQLDELPGKVLHGTIAELAKADLKVAPRELVKGSDLSVRVDKTGVPRPLAISYQARVVLEEHDFTLLAGSRGRAKILVDPQSLADRIYRYLERTFTFSV